MRYFLFSIIIFVFIVSETLSQIKYEKLPGQIKGTTYSIKYKTYLSSHNGKSHYDSSIDEENMNFGKRFLYSQKILWPTSIAGHIGLYTISSEPVTWDMFKLQTIKESFTKLPIIEHDPWNYNYIVHPIMGSFSYLAYRNLGGSWWESLIGTSINSIIYEYIIASSTQRPSIIDLTVTPVGGTILGEGIYQLKKSFTRDNYLSPIEKIIITILDPFEIIHVKFRYHRLIN